MRLQTDRTINALPQSTVSDIAFLLMVFFLLTAAWSAPRVMRTGLSGSSAVAVDSSDLCDIFISQNVITVNGIPTNENELASSLPRGSHYRIMTSDDVAYSKLVDVLDRMSSAGIDKIEVVTDDIAPR